MKALWWYLRLHAKLFLYRYRCLDSFCKRCGRKVTDFAAPDALYNEVTAEIQRDRLRVVCFDCFTDLGREKKLFDVLDVMPHVLGHGIGEWRVIQDRATRPSAEKGGE